MGALRALAAVALLVLATPAARAQVERWTDHIAEASARFGVPEEWIWQVMRAESGGHTLMNGRPITSRAGAMGLMQLMPGTWTEMRAAYGLGLDPHEPRDNILAGTAYLRLMHDRFGYPGLFAAYNAGPARYARHLQTGRPLPPETVAYVQAVAGGRRGPEATSPVPIPVPANTMFALRTAPDASVPALPPPPSKHVLFVRLTTVSDTSR